MSYIKSVILYLPIFIVLISISKIFNLYDKPNSRKIHKNNIINSGGIIIYIYYLCLIYLYEFNHNIELIISIGFFVCLAGFIDDRLNLGPSIKIILILMPSFYLIFKGINISDLGYYEYVGLINLGKFQIPFLILSIGLLVNATNYIDGIDGLLLTFFSSLLIYYIFIIEDKNTLILLKLLLIPVILNLFFNFLSSKSKMKIFSGNSGSLFIGFLASFLTIEFYKNFNIHPVYLIWPLWYPVYDFLFVTLNRALNKKSIFFADNTHLHHKILKKFKHNHLNTVLIFIIVNTIIIYTGFYIGVYSKILSLILFIFGFVIYFFIRFKLK